MADLYYFEEDYYTPTLGYFVYTADAASAQSSTATIGCDAIRLTPKIEGAATINAEFSQSVIGSRQASLLGDFNLEFTQSSTSAKQVSVESQMSLTFSQSAVGARDRDIDLFAFSDAAITAQVNAIRDNNVSASLVFDIATDGRRFRDLASAEDAVFSFVANNERSRASSIETQAAFSFGVQTDLFKDFASSNSTEVTVTVTGQIIKTSSVSLTSEITSTTLGDRIRFGFAVPASQFSLSAIARQIADAHLTSFNQITLNVVANYTVRSSASLEAYAYTYAITPKYRFARPRSMPTYTFDRGPVSTNQPTTPVFGSGFAYSPTTGAGVLQFGQSTDFTISSGENFVFELYHSSPEVFVNDPPVFAAYGNATSMLSGNLNTGTSWALGKTSSSTEGYGNLQVVFWNGTAWVYIKTTYNLSTDIWRHIVFRRINGTTLQLLVDGTVRGSTDFSGAFRTPTVNNRYIRVRNHSGVGRSWVDEWTFRRGGDGSFNYPNRTQNYEGTLFYYRFDDNWVSNGSPAPEDFTGLTVNAAAALTAAGSIYFRSTTSQFGKANITANSTLTAVIGKLEEINLVAFDDAEVNANVNVIRNGSLDVSTSASVSTTAERLRGLESTQSSEFAIATEAYRVRFNSVNSSSEFSQTSSAVKTTNAIANLLSEFTQSSIIGTLEDINLVAFSNGAITANAVKTASAESAINVSFTQDSIVNKIAYAESQLSAEHNLTAINSRLRDFSATITTSASSLTLAEEFVGIDANINSRFSIVQSYYEQEDGYYIDNDYFESFNITATKIASGSAAFTSSSTLSASIRTDVFVAMVVSSAATVFATVVKTTDTTVLQVNQFTLSSTVVKTTSTSASANLVFTIVCNGVTAAEINLVAFSNATLSATPEATKPFSSVLSSQSTVFAYTQDSLNSNGQADVSSQFTLSAAVNYIPLIVISTEAIASNLTVVVKTVAVAIPLDNNLTLVAGVQRFRDNQIAASAASSLTATAVKTTNTSVAVSSTFTETADVSRVITAQISTQAIATNLTAVVKIARLLITCEVVASINLTASVIKNAQGTFASAVQVNTQITKIVSAQSSISSSGSISAVVGLRKQGVINVSSALSFVVAIRDLRLDEIIYVIPGENYTYVINSESRIHDIYGETRIRSITGETRIRTITGESRIHIID